MVTEALTIDVNTLNTWLNQGKLITLLDLRPKEEREEWSIPGSMHTPVYDLLKSNNPSVFDNLNIEGGVPVITVCGFGRKSLVAAEKLKEKGYEAYSLEGGMKAWNYAWNTAEKVFDDGPKVIQVRRSSKGCLSYVVGSEDKAVVIDASLDPHVYKKIAREQGWQITYVMDTHIHADYISRSRDLAEFTGAQHILIDKAKTDFQYSPVRNGEVIAFGNAFLKVIHTPGHTLESTSFKIGEALFSGDTLFVDGVGRPDLKASHEEAIKKSRLLFNSLKQLLSLTDTTWVLPAHSSTSVAFDNHLIAATIRELKALPIFRFNEDEFLDYTLTRIPPTPPNFLTIAMLNKLGSHAGYDPAELEAGANRCAIPGNVVNQ